MFAAPWWVSAILALLAHFASHWIVPAIAENSPVAKAMVAGVMPFGTVMAFFLAVIAVVRFLQEQLRRSSALNAPVSKHAHAVAPTAAPAVTNPDSAAQAWNALLNKAPSAPSACPPTQWSMELLRQIEWKRIEELTAAFFREQGFRAETIRAGADGGVDVRLYRIDAPDPDAIIQCKAWNSQRVGVKPVRELLGVMAHEGVSSGYFLTTGDYTAEAVEFAKGKTLRLISGEVLLEKIRALPDEAQQRLLLLATAGDYMTPTCPSCGIKMVRRKSSRGDFWGCSNYPRCRQKFFMKAGA